MNKTDVQNFAPNWASAPGETLSDIIAEKHISEAELAKLIKTSLNDVKQLLDGSAGITEEIARHLANLFGMSPAFWTKRQAQYSEDLARLQNLAQTEENNWLSELPVRDMINYGWIQSSANPIAACLSFFGVRDVGAWQKAYQKVLSMAAFRTSPTFESEAGAVAAWLRQGEIVSNRLDCKPWNPKLLSANLPKIRLLTKKGNPNIFIPELQKYCAECGVAVVVLRAPTGCRASGATRFISTEKAVLLLSCRYLSDDHFWFTFFHEAGHLLLHGKESLFLEGIDSIPTKKEEEANAFAAEVLLPQKLREELYNLPLEAFNLIKFARHAGISPGILIGQLQFYGRIRPNHFNRLKRRFRWAE